MRLFNASNLCNVVLVPAAFLSLLGTSAANCVPDEASLISGIPTCAWCCVQDFILTNYPSRSGCGLKDLDCLCRTETRDGFTLGEAALSCTLTYCPVNVISSVDVYGICVDVPGALPETHSTITATIVATIAIPEPPITTTSAVTSDTFTSSHRSTPLPTSTSLTSSAVPSASPAPSQISSTPIPSTPSPQTVTSASPSSSSTSAQAPLSTPAVVGVSVASGVSAAFLIGVLLFLCSRRARQRHLRATQRDTFEIGGHMAEPILAASPPVNRPPSGGYGGAHFQNFPVAPLVRGPLVVVNQSPAHSSSTKEAGIGTALTPETNQTDSPASRASQRTVSQLLPEKPDYGLYPEPLHVDRFPEETVNDGAVFDGDSQQRHGAFSDSLQQVAQPTNFSERNVRRVPQGNPNMGLPTDPRAVMYGPERVRNLTRDQQNFAFQRPPMPEPPPLREQHPALRTADHFIGQSNWYPPVNRNPNYSVNGDMSVNRQFAANSARNSGRNSQRFVGPRSSFNRRSSSRISGNSDTSFESVGYEDDDDDGYGDWSLGTGKQLSPVKEYSTPYDSQKANGGQQPGAMGPSPIRYPRMPRSASISRDAEVIPRPRAAAMYEGDNAADRQGRSRGPAPIDATSGQFYGQVPMFLKESPSSSRDHSPAGSLLAKRRGDGVADKMETEFRTTNIAAQNDQRRAKWKVIQEGVDNETAPDRLQRPGTGAPKTPPNQSSESGNPGPQLGHNITPSRRGGDLYLSVD